MANDIWGDDLDLFLKVQNLPDSAFKPCPKCGSTWITRMAVDLTGKYTPGPSFFVGCLTCDCRTVNLYNPMEVVKKWNNREVFYPQVTNTISRETNKKENRSSVMKKLINIFKKGIATIATVAVVCTCGFAQVGKNVLAYNAGIEAFVNSLYSDCLGRSADPTGFNDWCNKLATGQITGKQAAYGFFFSPEFQAKANAWSDTELINAYYKVFLNRGSDPSGASYWAQQIAGTTNDISILFTGFADSTEFANKCASYGITVGPHVNVPTTVRGTNTIANVTNTTDFTRWALSYATGTNNYSSLAEYAADNTSATYANAPRYPYVMNGLSTTSGIDCSGLNCYIIQQYWGRTDCPHNMWTQATTYGTTIDASQIQPGDLLCDYSDGGIHGWMYFYVGRTEDVFMGITFHYDYILAGKLSEDGTQYYPQIRVINSADGTIDSWLAVGNRRVARLG